jgi:hypothetical protein
MDIDGHIADKADGRLCGGALVWRNNNKQARDASLLSQLEKAYVSASQCYCSGPDNA